MKITSMYVRRNMLSNLSGFSLVELIVVVAIIGILAAVAIPQYAKVQNKSKQSEVNVHLSGIYSAELSFYEIWTSYYGALETIGYSPKGRVRYNCGFTAVGPASPKLGAPTGTVTSFRGNLCIVGGAPAAICQFDSDVTATNISASVRTSTLFTAQCITRFNNMPAASRDTWTIRQDKVIAQTSKGI